MKPVPIPFIAAKGYAHTQAWLQALQRAMPEQRILAWNHFSAQDKARCEVAIVANPDPAELTQLPQLRWIHSVWAGVERLIADLGHSQLKIVRLQDPRLADTMAEAVLAWTLYLHRGMPIYARQQREKSWRALEYTRPQDRHIGLLGLGALGETAATRLLQAGFRVSGWGRSRKTIAGLDCYAGNEELPLLLAKIDILVCLLPLTPDTRNLINADSLSTLPRGASLINFARSAIVCEADLRAALDKEHIAHAVLDVFETEPLPANAWYWLHPSVTVLPHCSAPTDKESASLIVGKNVQRYLAHGILPETVDIKLAY